MKVEGGKKPKSSHGNEALDEKRSVPAANTEMDGVNGSRKNEKKRKAEEDTKQEPIDPNVPLDGVYGPGKVRDIRKVKKKRSLEAHKRRRAAAKRNLKKRIEESKEAEVST